MLVVDALAKVDFPVTVSVPPTLVFPVTPRLDEVALASVVFPVTVSDPAVVPPRTVVPVAVKLPVVRFDVLAFERLV